MRTMGLDLGTKTIGVAVSDALGWTAQGVTTILRKNLAADLEALRELVREHDVTRVVLGLPLNMDGSEGPRAEASRKFAGQLTEALSLPVEFWDERLTTAEAQRVLITADVSRAKRKKVVDQMAATLILDGWLQAHQVSQSRNAEPENGEDD